MEAKIRALDVDGQVEGIEREIERLDADRRVHELEAGLDALERRLGVAVRAVRD